MPITWRPATWNDIEPCLAIQPTNRGDGFPDVKSALKAWKQLFDHPFFVSGVFESATPTNGHSLVGFGCGVLVTSGFADAEISNPRPDITSRIIASLDSGSSALASWNDVAQANAGAGVDIANLMVAWRDDILSPQERHDLQVAIATGFTEVVAGYRMRRILLETTTKPVTDFHRRSLEYQVVAEFPEIGRVIHLMTKESAAILPGSLGNVIFKAARPLLRLRESDQQLLLAALKGATDTELAAQLGLTPSAVKARWRSAFARIEEMMPDLVDNSEDHDGRGAQKRHRVLAYVRTHMEELRPYDWQAQGKAKSARSI